MIKFFRKIRQRLLSESKFSKYLLYAIGEIALVIIGILIALQINTYNTNRILVKEAEDFSERLLVEVQANISATHAEIQKEDIQISSSLTILNMFHVDRSELRSRDLDSLIYLIITKNEIDISLATLEEGLNTGKIPLIRSDSLRNLLYSLPTILQKVKDSEKIGGNDIDNFLTPFLYEHHNWRNMDFVFSEFDDLSRISAFPEHNSLECLDHVLFENLVDNRYYNANDQRLSYQELEEHLELLEKLLTL